MLLQVLRVRHAPRAPVLAGGGREAARRRRAARREGAARADRRAARGQRRGGRAAGRLRPRGLHLVRGLGLRARAGAGDAPAHQRRGLHARGAGAAARGDRLAGPDAGVGQPGPGRPPGLADQAPRRAAGDDPRRRRAAHPVHERDPRRHRRVAGGAHRRAGGARRGPSRARPPAGGDPAELRPAPALLRGGAGRDRRRGAELADPRRAGAAAGLGAADLARRHAPARARVAPADAGRRRPDPAQPVGLVAAARGGGRHRPGRAVGQRRPHLAGAPVPVAAPDAQAAPAARLRAHRAALRLPAVPRSGLDGAGRARRGEAQVLVASSRGAARAGARSARSGASWCRARSRAPATARRCRPRS